MADGRGIERETVIGAVVLVAGIAILAMAYSGSVNKGQPGYDLTARFTKAEGIELGAQVRLAGVTVGSVTAQTLDPKFRALLTLRLRPEVKLPKDSAALIETDGLLGSKFVAIQPGADDDDLKPGAEMRFTQSSMNLGDILELIVSQAENARGASAPLPDALPDSPANPSPAK